MAADAPLDAANQLLWYAGISLKGARSRRFSRQPQAAGVFTAPATHPFRFALFLALTIAAFGGRAIAAEERSVDTGFRVFLRDGTAVATYGDFARVGDRIVFSVAIGAGEQQQLQVVSLPVSSVDVEKTEQYAVSVRAARYAATGGESDYAALTAQVAKTLNQVTANNSPIERLQIAEQMRGIVATWSRDHYAYRAADVRQIQSLLDELVADLRSDAGVNQFDLNLVANTEPPPPPTLRRPTPAEAIEQVLRVARATDVPADRVTLLQAIMRVLERPSPVFTREWAKRMREAASGAVADEMRTDRAYRDLSRNAITRALAAASRADAPGVEEVLNEARRRDERLGRKRPGEMASLVAAIENHLDNARRLRLARDRWQRVYPALRLYEELVSRPLQQLAGARKSLEAIQRLAGPDPDVLLRLRDRLVRTQQAIARIVPPADAVTAHATLGSACQLALRAADTRERAIDSGNLQVAWDASSAAAGAMMLLAQARDQMQAALRPPELK